MNKFLLKGAAFLLMVSRAGSFSPTVHTFTSSRSVSALYADTTPPKVDYVNHIESLSHLLQETKENLSRMKRLASELKQLELTDPSLSDLGSGAEADALRKALAEAKAACDTFGPSSPETRAAWVELELTAAYHEPYTESHTSHRYSAVALKMHHYYNAAVDAQLLTDSINALDTIESLSHFVEVEKNRLEEQPWLTT